MRGIAQLGLPAFRVVFLLFAPEERRRRWLRPERGDAMKWNASGTSPHPNPLPKGEADVYSSFIPHPSSFHSSPNCRICNSNRWATGPVAAAASPACSRTMTKANLGSAAGT